MNVKSGSAVQLLLSVEPSFNWDALTVTEPLESNETWISWRDATGSISSVTVTVKLKAVPLPSRDVLPASSST